MEAAETDDVAVTPAEDEEAKEEDGPDDAGPVDCATLSDVGAAVTVTRTVLTTVDVVIVTDSDGVPEIWDKVDEAATLVESDDAPEVEDVGTVTELDDALEEYE